MGASPRRYDLFGRAERLGYAACWAALFLVAVGVILIPETNDALVVKAIGVVSASATAFFAFRALRWETIDVSPEAVVVRGIVHSLKLPRKDVDRFVSLAHDGLAVQTRAGNTILLGDFQKPVPAPKVAEQLNDWLAV